MVSYGYTLSSEEHGPTELVRFAEQAEAVGFEFLSISDHYHPWTTSQGQSPFVWTTIGAVAARTTTIGLGVGVVCPLIRIHPAVVAQAAATAAVMMEGRFFLGVGTGELLNEHITGERWPAIETRLEMLREAVGLMQRLWSGEAVDHTGRYYTVENARLFTHPVEPPDVVVSAFGSRAARLAGELGGGLWSTSPDAEVVETFEKAGGSGRRVAQITLCHAEDRREAVRTVLRTWPNAAIPGQLSQDLPTWTHFETAATLVDAEQVASVVPCGPDPEPVIELVERYLDAGFDHLHFHQVGSDQDGFFRFWERSLLPAL
ncbi:MAG: TIGR03557 family F420-dependent LLM class oxidoreductase [Acidimicrobiales bacterium]|nr:TIGR03557 family F420-dependent LLM class oxidoreductase [Acidimicrobiales bacterium]